MGHLIAPGTRVTTMTTLRVRSNGGAEFIILLLALTLGGAAAAAAPATLDTLSPRSDSIELTGELTWDAISLTFASR